ncbi:MAG: hypothetical protein ACK40D_02000 [Cyanobacteriota bacterium]
MAEWPGYPLPVKWRLGFAILPEGLLKRQTARLHSAQHGHQDWLARQTAAVVSRHWIHVSFADLQTYFYILSSPIKAKAHCPSRESPLAAAAELEDKLLQLGSKTFRLLVG